MESASSLNSELEHEGRHIVNAKARTSRKLPTPSDISESEINEAGTKNTRIAWSDNEDSDAAYKNFKKRKSLKRKRGRKRKARDSRGEDDRSKSSTRRSVSDISDDEAYGPNYVRNRRAGFDGRRKVLKDAGLKLPPIHDDVDFSGDQRQGHLKEKPVFLHVKPLGPYKDIELPLSLGLIPASIAQWLRDYQIKGVEFLHRLFVYQTGGILGDDMGLGKTVQVIAFLTAAFGKSGDETDSKRMRRMRRAGAEWYPRVLVICPGTLIQNWRDELERWGYWHVGVYHGSDKDDILQTAASGRLEIVITTYTTYRLNKDMINQIEWDCVVADECHQIKGHTSETSKAMNDINALCRIGLTGTAMQNSYEELWVLLNWTSPGQLGPLSEWRRTISEPLRIGQSHEATMQQLGFARKVARSLVDNLLPRFFLRRMKTLIADQLPKKSDRVVFCPLTNTQARAYKAFLESEVVEYIRTSSEMCQCASGKKRGWCCYQFVPEGSRWQNYVFSAIANLQKLANHLAILIPQSTDPEEKQEKDLVMLKAALPGTVDRQESTTTIQSEGRLLPTNYTWQDLYHSGGSIVHFSNTEFCGKWKVLKKLLKFWHDANDKVLVFSHSVRLLKMLHLLFKNTAYNVSYLDGSMSYEERANVVSEYNADPNQFVFLISTKAGGVGLNITSANKVVIVDPNWNPAWDLQAQDRAYRIGQTRDVEVFRLVSAGTIEEIVYARQIYKQQQAAIGYTASTERRYFRGVQHSGSNKGEIFGLKNLFEYVGDATQSVLQDIVNKTNVAESRAGVNVVDFDLKATQSTASDEEDPLLTGDHEDSAMANLAEMIKSQTPPHDESHAETDANAEEKPKKQSRKANHPKTAPKKSDPIQAILAGAGVEYTHENSEVVGPSRVEARLSKKAEAHGNEVGLGSQRLFRASQESQTPKGAFHRLVERDIVRPADRQPHPRERERPEDKDDDGLHTRYHPPEDVRRRHFCSMARAFGFESAVDFGLIVEGWTPEQRKEALDRFYEARKTEMEVESVGGQHGEEVESNLGSSKRRSADSGLRKDRNNERLQREVDNGVRRLSEDNVSVESGESTASESEDSADGTAGEAGDANTIETDRTAAVKREQAGELGSDESTASESELETIPRMRNGQQESAKDEIWEL